MQLLNEEGDDSSSCCFILYCSFHTALWFSTSQWHQNLSLSPGNQNAGAGKAKEAEIRALISFVNFERYFDRYLNFILVATNSSHKKKFQIKKSNASQSYDESYGEKINS